MFAPQMALRPEYDLQSIRQDYLYKSEHHKYPDLVGGEGDGGWLKGWKRLEIFCHQYVIILIFGVNTFYFNG